MSYWDIKIVLLVAAGIWAFLFLFVICQLETKSNRFLQIIGRIAYDLIYILDTLLLIPVLTQILNIFDCYKGIYDETSHQGNTFLKWDCTVQC